jgi:hypothetical protein
LWRGEGENEIFEVKLRCSGVLKKTWLEDEMPWAVDMYEYLLQENLLFDASLVDISDQILWTLHKKL